MTLHARCNKWEERLTGGVVHTCFKWFFRTVPSGSGRSGTSSWGCSGGCILKNNMIVTTSVRWSLLNIIVTQKSGRKTRNSSYLKPTRNGFTESTDRKVQECDRGFDWPCSNRDRRAKCRPAVWSLSCTWGSLLERRWWMVLVPAAATNGRHPKLVRWKNIGTEEKKYVEKNWVYPAKHTTH